MVENTAFNGGKGGADDTPNVFEEIGGGEVDVSSELQAISDLLPGVIERLGGDNKQVIANFFEQKYGHFTDFGSLTKFGSLGLFIENNKENTFAWSDPLGLSSESEESNVAEISPISIGKFLDEYQRLFRDSEDNGKNLGNEKKTEEMARIFLEDIVDVNLKEFPEKLVNEKDPKVFLAGLQEFAKKESS